MEKRYICCNPNNYHYDTEVNNFSWNNREPYEECGRYCDECPYAMVVGEKGKEVCVIYHETIGYDDYEPQLSVISEMETEELRNMLEGLKEAKKIFEKELKKDRKGKRTELSPKDIEIELERTESMIEEIEKELINRGEGGLEHEATTSIC